MGKVGLVYGFVRKIGTILIKSSGSKIGAEQLAKDAWKGKMSVFDAVKTYCRRVKTFAENDANSVLPSNPFPAMKKYWQTHSGKDFKTLEFLKSGDLIEWAGPAFIVLPEIGNIYRAFTDGEEKGGGIREGTSEIRKTTERAVGGTIGAIAASIVPVPFLNALAGYLIGDWAATFATGKTHTDKVEEMEAARQKSGNASVASDQQGGGAGGGYSAGANSSVSFGGGSANLNSYASNFANQYASMFSNAGAGLNSFNSYNNSYANDFMTQSIFGNMNNNINNMNLDISPFNFQNSINQYGYNI